MKKSSYNNTFRLLSFDIEEWFLGRDALKIPVEKWPLFPERVLESTHTILRLLREHNQKAIFYVLGWIAERYPELIKQIVNEGHTIGFHSYFHQLPETQNHQEFEEELIKGLSVLEKIADQKIKHYRAPLFSLNDKSLWIIPVLMKHGIEISSSTLSGNNLMNSPIPSNPFCFKIGDRKMIELPLNRLNFFGKKIVFSGSGYARIIPKSIIDTFFNRSKYTITYFHPRDFDVNVPRTKDLSFWRNLMNRSGNKTTISKLDLLLNKYDFISPESVTEQFFERCPEEKYQIILLDNNNDKNSILVEDIR